ncbi:hypothetical protein IQ22_01171 [Pseudomonas duriflava]|uniref:Phosphatidate cytidylyltransferase n=1 Tax=Pseudomonas duriflava TaxID=459528 RepID=A0A562QJ04_9PSED|nr:hypothetical protein [Pseudomonas duriflava]TWI56719.1 hypothetical protein IQ22_01171 [Pseudomonas duriflava]
MNRLAPLPPPPAALLDAVAWQATQPVRSELHVLCETVRARFGEAVIAVLFYGSCLRSGNPSEGIVDLYAIVDNYAHAHANPLLRLANTWLPPNVFMLQARTAQGDVLQTKCAVLSLRDLERGTAQWFQSYLWGRFAQPSRLVYCRDEQTARRIHQSVAHAVLRLLSQTLPCLPERFDSATLWQLGLALSYGTELRPESASRPAELVGHNHAYYRQLTTAAAPALVGLEPVAGEADAYRHALSAQACAASRQIWKQRRLQGRALNIARLIKSVFTFENGVDYIAWKLERHLGQPVEVTPRLRRYPLIFGWPLLWRLLRDRRLR